MCVGKSDWQSQSNEENLFCLLSVEVYKPTVEEFPANHRGKAVSLWYNNQNHRMHQQQPKAYKKREMKQMETESVNFNLTLIFEGFDSGSHNSNVGFD